MAMRLMAKNLGWYIDFADCCCSGEEDDSSTGYGPVQTVLIFNDTLGRTGPDALPSKISKQP